MPTIIHIEPATTICSCALSQSGKLIISKVNHQGQSHATSLGVFIEEIMAYVRSHNLKVDAIAVSSGPGSYTGLRIGVSEAKGLCYGLDVPMIAVPTLKIMAEQVKEKVPSESILCPMIDARRMEVYSAFYTTFLEQIRKTAADIINEDTYNEILENNTVYFFGNGASKCQSVITHQNAHFIENISPLAETMINLSEAAFHEKDFVDSAYFEPYYLKEFVATVPKNKIINN